MNITIYSTTTCPYCRMLKKYLSDKGVNYIEKLTDLDQKVQEEMLQLSDGFLGVPFTVIKKSDGSLEKIIGFDKKKIDSTLNIS